MKKIFLKICSFATSLLMMTNSTVSAIVEDRSFESDLEEIETEKYESCLKQIEQIDLKLTILNRRQRPEDSDEISELNNERDSLLQEIKLYGGETFDDNSLMEEVLLNADYSHSAQAKGLTPSELTNLVSQLKGFYRTVGREGTPTINGKSYRIYQINILQDGNKFSQEKLTRTITEHFYKNVSPNSTAADHFINETIRLYCSKIASAVAEYLVPAIKFVPYELFFSSKPSPSQISTTGDGVTCELSTNNIIKFTYVYDDKTKSWVYCSSSNWITYAFSTIVTCFTNGNVDKRSKDYPSDTIDGGYNDATKNSITVFNAMQQSNYYIGAANTCVNKVSCKTIYEGSVSVDILAPNSPMNVI